MVSDYRHVALLFRRSRKLFRLPDYTILFLGLLEYLISSMQWNHVCHWSRLLFGRRIPRTRPISCDVYDKVQADYAGARATDSWSERLAAQFGSTWTRRDQKLLEKHKLLWNEERRFWTEVSPFIEKEEIMASPTIAIVGHSNVWKNLHSFNRIAGSGFPSLRM